jgi:hypothetical protein
MATAEEKNIRELFFRDWILESMLQLDDESVRRNREGLVESMFCLSLVGIYI